MTERKGYTLIEILIVIALFSILLSMGLPNMRLFRAMKEKQELTEFRKDLLYARNMAIVENKRYHVFFFHDDDKYIIKTTETSPPIKTKTFSQGLSFCNNNKVANFIFNPSGTTGNSNTIFIDTDLNNRYRISLTPATGRIEIYLE